MKRVLYFVVTLFFLPMYASTQVMHHKIHKQTLQLASCLYSYFSDRAVDYGCDGLTNVVTPDGLQPIQDLGQYDIVQTRFGWQLVQARKVSVGARCLIVQHTRGSMRVGFQQQVLLAHGAFVSAETLQPGDVLSSMDQVISVQEHQGLICLYCLCMPDSEYTLADGLVVHNFDPITAGGAMLCLSGMNLSLTAALTAGVAGVVCIAQKVFGALTIDAVTYDEMMSYPEDCRYAYHYEVVLQAREYYQQQKSELLAILNDLQTTLKTVFALDVMGGCCTIDPLHQAVTSLMSQYQPLSDCSLSYELDLDVQQRAQLMKKRDQDLDLLVGAIADREAVLVGHITSLVDLLDSGLVRLKNQTDELQEFAQAAYDQAVVTGDRAGYIDVGASCIKADAMAQTAITYAQYLRAVCLYYKNLPSNNAITQLTMLVQCAEVLEEKLSMTLMRLQDTKNHLEQEAEKILLYVQDQGFGFSDQEVAAIQQQAYSCAQADLQQETAMFMAKRRENGTNKGGKDKADKNNNGGSNKGNNKDPRKFEGNDADAHGFLKDIKNQADRRADRPPKKSLFRDPKTGKWWTYDASGHKCRFKEYIARATFFEWVRDTDAWGRTVDKWKSPVDKIIKFKDVVFRCMKKKFRG